MSCKLVGHSLPHLIAVLAETETGTQCSKCWSPLRSVRGARVSSKEAPELAAALTANSEETTS